MVGISEGDELAEFYLKNQNGEEKSSEDIDNAIIYFYPKADTPGCTKEACNFRDSIEDFEGLDIEVYGISVDTVEDQKEFSEKYDLKFDLLADSDGAVSEKFGVLKDSGFAERTTFIVSESRVEKKFENVDPEEHVTKVKDYLENN